MAQEKNDWFADTLRNYHRKANKYPSTETLVEQYRSAKREEGDLEKYKSEMIVQKPRTAYLSIRGINIFEFYSEEGLWWFRVFGVGLHFKDTSTRTMYFSERNGYWKSVRLGRWFIKFLPYHKIA